MLFSALFSSFPEIPDDFVPGRISRREHFAFRRDVLKADPEILSIIADGYRVPFKNGVLPPPSFEPNNRSALDHSDFLLQELLRWEKIGCTTLVHERPRIVLPVSVVFSNKWRAVVDASRSVNPYVSKNSVVLDSLSSVSEVIQSGDWMTKQDLSAGYHHIMIHPEYRTLFGVHYVFPSGEVMYWHWNVLFLGERNAVHLFTKILRPHRNFLAAMGVRHRLYIDDFLIVSSNCLKCLSDTQKHLEALFLAGWVVKPAKCINHPAQKMTFLGLDVDSTKLSFFVPVGKRALILDQIQRVLMADFVPVRSLASLYGQLIAVSLAIGPVIRMLTRFGFAVINSASSWNQLVFVSYKCKLELGFVARNFDELNGHSFSRAVPQLAISSTFFASDASGVGLGTIELTGEGGFILVQQLAFSKEDMSKSSTFRELKAFHLCYTNLELLSRLANQRVKHFTDNYNLVNMFKIGSKRSHLHSLLFDIFLNLKMFNITLEVVWLPRSDPTMVVADYFSRDLDTTDYGISEKAFAALATAWGLLRWTLLRLTQTHA